MTKIRLLKPNVPKTGYYDIPVRDEIEMEKPILADAALAEDPSAFPE